MAREARAPMLLSASALYKSLNHFFFLSSPFLYWLYEQNGRPGTQKMSDHKIKFFSCQSNEQLFILSTYSTHTPTNAAFISKLFLYILLQWPNLSFKNVQCKGLLNNQDVPFGTIIYCKHEHVYCIMNSLLLNCWTHVALM